MDCSCADYVWIIVMFLSAVGTLYYDGTHSLQSWWTSNVNVSEKKKQAHPHLGWPEGEYIFSKNVWVNNSFKNPAAQQRQYLEKQTGSWKGVGM